MTEGYTRGMNGLVMRRVERDIDLEELRQSG
jgi:hypothetical protein